MGTGCGLESVGSRREAGLAGAGIVVACRVANVPCSANRRRNGFPGGVDRPTDSTRRLPSEAPSHLRGHMESAALWANRLLQPSAPAAAAVVEPSPDTLPRWRGGTLDAHRDTGARCATP